MDHHDSSFDFAFSQFFLFLFFGTCLVVYYENDFL